MATSQSTVDFLIDHMQDAGSIRSRKMFGEYAIYCNDKVVALVCDNQLFIKPTEVGYTFLDATHEALPYPGAKNYLCVPKEKWNNAVWLTDFIQKTAAALPKPKPKKK